MLKRIVIIGPESTGKSTLCEMLSKHYETIWVKEFAREYLLQHGTNYSFDDLLTIAKGQLQLQAAAEEQLLSSDDPQLLFMDTDMYVMKVWCEFVFGQSHNWILNKLVEQQCDLYLLCDTDLPWVKDELREYPDLESRERLYHIYKDNMINQNVPWVNIHGNYAERLEKAIAAVDQLLNKK